MSSQEEEESPQASQQVKSRILSKRKKQRACDYCRRKKIRCNGAEMPGHQCSRCINLGIECTYEPINTRPPNKSYVQVLEHRLQNMETLFAQLHPDVEFPKDFGVTLDTWLRTASKSSQASSTNPPPVPNVSAVSPPPPDSPSVHSDELEPSEDEIEARRTIIENLKRTTVPTNPVTLRYHGKSSNLMFLQTIIDLKEKYAGTERSRSAEPTIRDTSMQQPPEYPYPNHESLSHIVEKDRVPYEYFPDSDLMNVLVNAYFKHINVYLPLLHRPTFEKGVRDNLHLREQTFGAVVLLVCANGSRWTDDPRVLADERLPGWLWFEQVETARWSLLARPQVGDLQACALIAIYLGSTHASQGSWTVLGLGLRMAQDVGAHRKKMYGLKPTVEDELWKRAFWVLVALDRVGSFGLGRPCAIHDEDFDVDPMLECDDEYWDNPDPEQAFKQPEGKPSTIAFANCLLHLWKILAFASRTIYSINKVKLTLGYVGPQWQQKIVAELDSALNKWIDTVPDHLKWDPTREDEFFMNQSATLYANYYLLQICVHRPFIASHRKASRLPFPSLTICTNAARSCTHVLDTQYQRNQTSLLLIRFPLFTAGLVLILNMWAGKRSGLSNEANMNDIHKCMYMLKRLENHTFSARRLWGVLNGLLSIGDLPPPGAPLLTSTEKLAAGGTAVSSRLTSAEAQNSMLFTHTSSPANADDEHQTAIDNQMGGMSSFYRSYPGQSTRPTLPTQVQAQAPFAGTDGVVGMFGLGGMNGVPGGSGGGDMQMNFVLPVHTEDLGRLPFHHGFSLPQSSVPGSVSSLPSVSAAAPQQLQSFFDDLVNLQPQDAPGHPHAGPPHGESHGYGFPMSVTDYSELLAALSVPITSDAPGTGLVPAQEDRADGGGRTTAVDVSTISAENLAFADNMMEVWSTAPTSLEWDDWGAYLTSMSGMGSLFNQPPPPPPPPGF